MPDLSPELVEALKHWPWGLGAVLAYFVLAQILKTWRTWMATRSKGGKDL